MAIILDENCTVPNTLNNLIQNISLNKDINLFVLPCHGVAEILLKFALNINQIDNLLYFHYC